MPRWSARETECIVIVRSRLASLLDTCNGFPDVVGDRKIIRYLRGHDHNVDKVCGLMEKFIKWRKDNAVDEIRRDILEGGCDHPLKFPKGDIILQHIKALVIDPTATDNLGSPLCVEQYSFSPSEVLKAISIDEYIRYMIYTLEYRSLILEQLSEERERAYLTSLSDDRLAAIDSLPPYGVITNMCVIRDLGGVGFEHLGPTGQEIIKAVVSIATDNYPELMRKCYMINVPWIFNTLWYFIKNLLATRTLAKISVYGSGYMDDLNKEIRPDLLPRLIGGPYVGYLEYVRFPFDVAYFFPGRPARQIASPVNADSEAIIAVRTEATGEESGTTCEEESHNSAAVERQAERLEEGSCRPVCTTYDYKAVRVVQTTRVCQVQRAERSRKLVHEVPWEEDGEEEVVTNAAQHGEEEVVDISLISLQTTG